MDGITIDNYSPVMKQRYGSSRVVSQMLPKLRKRHPKAKKKVTPARYDRHRKQSLTHRRIPTQKLPAEV